MTTHDRDRIIAAAIGCIEGLYDRSRAITITITGNEIERLYAIAFEDGRQANLRKQVATHEQSLARIRNQVRDECAALFGDTVIGREAAALIRAMKEPE